jgi:hypothetical protein
MNGIPYADIYGRGISPTLSIQEQTVPEVEENDLYVNNTSTEPETGQTQIVDKNVILGGVAVVVIILLIMGFIE